jgi:hypothetical protein
LPIQRRLAGEFPKAGYGVAPRRLQVGKFLWFVINGNAFVAASQIKKEHGHTAAPYDGAYHTP